MFSKSVEYAINMINAMPKVGEVTSAKVLAKAGKIPPAYASKVLQSLRNAGIISSQRGVGGGVTLLIPANKLNVAQIIDAVAASEAPKKGTAAAKKADELRKYLAKMLVK